MIRELSRSIKKQPVRWLVAGAGVIAVSVAARKLTESPERREQLVNNLHSGYDRVRRTGNELWQEGVEGAHSLQQDAHAVKASMASTLDSHRPDGVAQKTSNRESAVAAFMATLLTKGVSSYLQWRTLDKARSQTGKATSSSNAKSEEALDGMTVVELRKVAAEQDIEGRSSMKKDDLVEALKE